MSFGLVSFSNATGERVRVADVVTDYISDVERLLSYGYQHMYRCSESVGLTDLAVEAGRKAMAAAGCAPADVNLIVLAITDIPEYLYWDAAAVVSHRLGLNRAEAVLLTQACTSGVVCFDTVAGKLATHDDYDTVLIITANRTCDTYWNRMDVQPMIFSDGAAAAVARRGHDAMRWIATEVITDGSYADFFRMDVGGAAAPFGGPAAEGLAPRARDAWDIMEFFDFDADRFEEYARLLDLRSKEVLERTCARSGLAVPDLARIVMLSDNTAAMTSFAELIGVPTARTNLELAQDHGHFGAADQLFCLGEYVAQDALNRGDRIALISRGRGLHWACTLLEV